MKKYVFLFLAAAFLAGCGVQSQKISLEYADPGYDGRKVKNLKVYLYKFLEGRADPARLGLIKDKDGKETGSITTDQDVPLLLSNALASELIRAGYDVRRVEAESKFAYAPSDLLVQGKVLSLQAEPTVGTFKNEIASHLELEVVIKVREQPRRRVYRSSFSKTVVVLSAESYKEAIEGVIRKAMPQAAKDIVELDQ